MTFPIWFLAHDLRGLFFNFIPAPQVCKSIFQSSISFSLAVLTQDRGYPNNEHESCGCAQLPAAGPRNNKHPRGETG